MTREDVLRVTRWIQPVLLSGQQTLQLEAALDRHAPGEPVLSGMGNRSKNQQTLFLLTPTRVLHCFLDRKRDTASVLAALPLAELKKIRVETLGEFRRWELRGSKRSATIFVRPGDDAHFQRCFNVTRDPAPFAGLYGAELGMPHSVVPLGQITDGIGLRHTPIGAMVTVAVTDRHVILETPTAPIETWDVTHLSAVHIDGETWRSGGGYAGGGMGLEGAAIGMVAAALLNSATAASGVVSACRFVFRASDFTVRVYNVAPGELARLLTPTFHYLEARDSAVPPPALEGSTISSSGDGLASEFVRLAELHAAGVLTAEEFTAAKAKLLN